MLPTGQDPLALIFWNDQTLESKTGGCYDGTILEISTDGGANFAQIPGTAMLTDPYNGPVDGGFSNPIAGLNAWCGDPQAYLRSVVDLTSYAGQTVKFRFRLASDSSVGRTPHGWYVDDVAIQSCQSSTSDVIFADSFD